ncbi:serine hydrolase FSH [Achaetomium macrosporum]|uniref:Serine hydrolase FSH n=1 Tax=Achaetomium macrosporum TaxID=79813 RepID=A0AAN7CBI9_9PEZI|nr:serine hydrolase FSH [Achaetomium macrosporum]
MSTAPTQEDEKLKPKPRLLLLHGGGTSPSIFGLQARKLALLLQPHFDLVFLQAPLPCPAGPGVLPFFDGCGPFFCWMDDRTPEAEARYWVEGMNQVVAEVERLGPFVGVLGFSQGAKVAMEVVRRLERVHRGACGDEKEEGACPSWFKVVVTVCGTAPFQGGVEGRLVRDGQQEARDKGFRESLAGGVVKAQSVHLIGEEDPWRPESEKLVEFFDEVRRTVIRFKGEHHMPRDNETNGQVARLILEEYQKV